jgi:hypothetical protein
VNLARLAGRIGAGAAWARQQGKGEIIQALPGWYKDTGILQRRRVGFVVEEEGVPPPPTGQDGPTSHGALFIFMKAQPPDG